MPTSEPTLFDMLATAILAVRFETPASAPGDKFPIHDLREPFPRFQELACAFAAATPT
jgi:hypothetical protein